MTAQFKITSARSLLLHLLFAASGVAALIYQVLWLRSFANVLGATAPAAAAVLAAFFLGHALGAEALGRLADRMRRPLKLYALLELGIAVAATAVPFWLQLYRSSYDALAQHLSHDPALFTAVKALLAGVALLPATALMGGTLPALGRALTGDEGPLGRRGGRLYAANLVGAVIGAMLATFALPLWIGIAGSYTVAVVLSIAVALVAGWLARDERPLVPASSRPPAQVEPHSNRLLAIVFASGFATIALEVLWTRMFALVLQNSVYSFGSVVAVFLTGLAAGAGLAAWLMGRFDVWRVLRVSLLVTGVLVPLTPIALKLLTDGLQLHARNASWIGYSASTLALTAIIILPAIVSAGVTLPCVWELWRHRPGAGMRLGRPVAINTLGAIVGPLAAGFVALPRFGLGTSITAIGVLYIIMGEAAVPASRKSALRWWDRAIIYPVTLFILLALSPTALPVASLETGERLIWAKEGARGAVAVVERDGDRRIKLDNHYALGGTALAVEERRHGHLPLLLHPQPRRVAMIGLGTGITAGAAVAHAEIERLVVLELVPEIIEAARLHFRPWNRSLEDDPRVRVVAEDGRNYIAGTRERFDVIIGDLYVPWREGVGSLYGRDHFLAVRNRLERGGIFAQWLPLWQLSSREFDIILATFLSVFDQVTVWRGIFSPNTPSIALVAHTDGVTVNLADIARRIAELDRDASRADGFLSELPGFMVLYAGELSGQEERFAAYGVNSDDRPLIEWLAPRAQRAVEAGESQWFTGQQLADFYADLNRRLGHSGDRILMGGPRRPWVYRHAGADFFRAEVLVSTGEARGASILRQQAYRTLASPEP